MQKQYSFPIAEDRLAPLLGQSDFRAYFSFYYCCECFQTLVIAGDRFSPKQIDLLATEKCPECLQPLTSSISCRTVEAPVDTKFWVHPLLSIRKNAQVQPVKFVNARSLFGLLSGINFVDSLVGGLTSDAVALFRGSNLPLLIAERYCVKVQLPENLGGLDSRALFIDAGNSFDIYLFTSIAREYELDFDRTLNRIIISRAFTPYELLQLVSREIGGVFDSYNPQLLVINDIFNLFAHDFNLDESGKIIRKLGLAIRKISQTKHVPIVITDNSFSPLDFLFRDYCNILADFNASEYQINARLLKHPSRPSAEIVQEVSDKTYNQQLLAPLKMMKHG